jgi:hypothetical protein
MVARLSGDDRADRLAAAHDRPGDAMDGAIPDVRRARARRL